MSTTWHIPSDSLHRYVAGDAGPVEANSIDAHLVVCVICRAAVADHRGAGTAQERTWRAIEASIDDLERGLVAATSTVLLPLVVPPLALLTVAAGLALFVGVVAADLLGHDTTPLLVGLAPLVGPLLAAVAFRPGIDPAGPMAEATAVGGGRLPFLRAGCAASIALVLGAIGSVLGPLDASAVMAWLAPSVALCALVAAVATWSNPQVVAGAGAMVWAVLVVMWTRGRRGGWSDDVDALATSRPGVQLCLLAVTLGSIALCIGRRNVRPDWRAR